MSTPLYSQSRRTPSSKLSPLHDAQLHQAASLPASVFPMTLGFCCGITGQTSTPSLQVFLLIPLPSPHWSFPSFQTRSRDVYGSYLFFSLTARVPSPTPTSTTLLQILTQDVILSLLGLPPSRMASAANSTSTTYSGGGVFTFEFQRGG